jgi:leucyl aminopeptidase
LKVNITASLALAENSISGDAYRPSDILTSKKGLTVEITNTDAEGRLVLADTMTWTQEQYNPKSMIELSTLTGACMIALGSHYAGLFTNSSELGNSLSTSGTQIGERMWEMPIYDEIREEMKGKVADLTNTGSTRYGGAIQAAAFLECFVEKGVNWAHVDIAG